VQFPIRLLPMEMDAFGAPGEERRNEKEK